MQVQQTEGLVSFSAETDRRGGSIWSRLIWGPLVLGVNQCRDLSVQRLIDARQGLLDARVAHGAVQSKR